MKLKIFNKILQPKVGVLVNIVMGASLHQHGHSHGGGHGHGDAEHGHGQGQHGQENINVKAAFIHVIGDFLQSLGRYHGMRRRRRREEMAKEVWR